ASARRRPAAIPAAPAPITATSISAGRLLIAGQGTARPPALLGASTTRDCRPQRWSESKRKKRISASPACAIELRLSKGGHAFIHFKKGRSHVTRNRKQGHC